MTRSPVPLSRSRLLLAIALGCHASVSQGQCPPGPGTNVGLIASGTWTCSGSPYRVNATVTAGNLTIGAGVRVELTAGAAFIVAGSLSATGNDVDPVVFTEASSGQGWGGILIQNVASAILLEHVVIERSTNSGLRIVDSNPTVRSCLIRDNSTSAATGGGGIAAVVGTGDLSITACEIRDNSSLVGTGGAGIAAVMNNGHVLRLRQCTLEGNIANPTNQIIQSPFWGGGLHLLGNGHLSNCLVRGNRGYTRAFGCSVQVGQGGGIFCDAGDLILENCIVNENMAHGEGAGSGCFLGAYGRGGGIAFVAAGKSLALTNCCLSGNSAEARYNWFGGPLEEYGVAAYVAAAASATLDHCTIAFNEWTQHGAGEAIRSDSVTNFVITNSIVYFNNSLRTTPPTYGDQLAGPISTSWSDVHNGFTGTGNTNQNPFFVQPVPTLGGSVLHPASPCIDAGDPASAADAAFPPSRGTTRCDMGALGGPLAAQFADPCVTSGGPRVYGHLLGEPNGIRLRWLGAVAGFAQITNAPPSSGGALLVGLEEQRTSLAGFTLLVGPTNGLGFVFVAYDATGSLSIPFSLAHPALLGLVAHVQALAFVSGTTRASNGLSLYFY